MFRKVNIKKFQKITEQDFNDFGNHPREAMDHIVRDFGGYPAGRYVGFPVEQVGMSTVRVGSGRYYKGDGTGYLFDATGGQTIDLLDFLPAVAKKIATVVVYGNTIDTDVDPREYLTDAQAGSTESQEMSTESRRQAYVSHVLGTENATPSPGPVAADFVAVAHVILTPAGVESITQLTANRVVSTYRNAEDIILINGRLSAVGPQIDTLRTDISGLASAVRTKAEAKFVHAIALDMARVKERVDLPDDYSTYGADHFLDELESDPDAPGYDCLVREGARFALAASSTARVALENAIDPRVTVNDNMVLPKYVAVPRLSIIGNEAEYPLTNTTQENVETRLLQETRIVREFLGSTYWCSNTSWWNSGQYDPITGIFRRGGETFVITSNPLPPTSVTDAAGNLAGRAVYAHRYTERSVIDERWEHVSTTENVIGSISAQTVLHSQDGYLAEHHFFVTKKASSGDIRVLICEVNEADQPMLHRVLAQTVIPNAQINVWPQPTVAAVKPVFIARGKRTARVYISSAAHFIALVLGNKLAQGARHYKQDGVWVQSLTGEDVAFEDRYCRFENPVVTVQLQPLELAGGINNIRINNDATVPEGTDIDYRIRVAGEWRSLREGSRNVNILASLPALVQFQAVLVGTTDVMPSFGVGENRSEVLLERPKTTMTHVSAPRLMPAPINSTEVNLRLENWDEGVGKHAVTVTILTGVGYATVETADAVSSEADPHDATVRNVKATFNLAAPSSDFKIKAVGASGSSAQRFHIAERADIEFA
jgi:hypothetical protein